jgi:Zn-dependent protease with chaperone function
VASTLLLGIQGVVYLLAGAIAEKTRPDAVVASLAAAGILALPAVSRLSRTRQAITQEVADVGRA